MVDPAEDRSERVTGAFARWLRPYFRRHFTAIRIAADGPPPELPADRPGIVVCNHAAWWDPILFVLLSRDRYPERPSYGPMDAEALERYPILRRLGVFGVEQGSVRGAAVFLRTGERLLADPSTLLWVTPQGGFADVREPIRLAPGIGHLATRARRAMILPVAIEYPFWNERLPELLVRFGSPLDAEQLVGAGPDAAASTIAARMAANAAALRDHSIARDPARFETFLAGRTGVGGLYDRWRALKARMSGEDFDPSHDRRTREPDPERSR